MSEPSHSEIAKVPAGLTPSCHRGGGRLFFVADADAGRDLVSADRACDRPFPTVSFESIGENANGLAGAIFATGAAGVTANADAKAPSVRLDFYDQTGLGTFTRG